MSESGKMQQKSDPKNSQTSTYSLQDSLVNPSPMQGIEKDSKIHEVLSFLKLLGLPKQKDLNICFLRTSQGYYQITKGKLLKQSSKHWMNSGMMRNGMCITHPTTCHKKDRECSFVQIFGKEKMKFRLNSHTKANIKQRIQTRETTWTIDTSKGKFSVWDEGWRHLTLNEKEQLQGFPKDWCETHQQIGNAVTVPVVEFILREMDCF